MIRPVLIGLLLGGLLIIHDETRSVRTDVGITASCADRSQPDFTRIGENKWLIECKGRTR